MTPNPNHSAPPLLPIDALQDALEQSHDVKAKVEAVADDLSSANDVAKDRMAEGLTALPVTEVLQTGLAVERTVQECADDLQEVTRTLAQGVEEVKAVEQALARSREALSESQDALAASRDAERTASQRATHDEKTGLPNRTLFDDRLAQAIAGADRRGWMLAVMFLDLDRFKLVNDNHGHAAGDAVLSIVAQRLLTHARDEDTVCRNGGDEFLYLLINPRTREDVSRIAGLVRATIAQPISLDALQFSITPSIGIALYPEHGRSADLLITHADVAMYRAKKLRSPFEFYEAPTGPETAAQMLQA
jgi:diguanylate cyclase (GGDEF)-like protein